MYSVCCSGFWHFEVLGVFLMKKINNTQIPPSNPVTKQNSTQSEI